MKVKRILKYKRVMRLISNVGRIITCMEFFTTLNILPVPCIYTMKIMYYIILNISRLEQNFVRHDYKACQRSGLKSQFCRTSI
jgi:hypothetical protein